MLSELRQNFDAIHSHLLTRRSSFRDALAELPPGLYDFWRHNACQEFLGIPRDLAFFTRAAEGLLTYFECASIDPMPYGLPSLAAESVWKAWLRFSPARLDAFCLAHFGRRMPPRGRCTHEWELETAALARTLARAQALAGIPATQCKLPALFTLDRRLRMPRGYGYNMTQGRIYYQFLDMDGRAQGTYYFIDADDLRASAPCANTLPRQPARETRLTRTSSANLELPFDTLPQSKHSVN